MTYLLKLKYTTLNKQVLGKIKLTYYPLFFDKQAITVAHLVSYPYFKRS